MLGRLMRPGPFFIFHGVRVRPPPLGSFLRPLVRASSAWFAFLSSFTASEQTEDTIAVILAGLELANQAGASSLGLVAWGPEAFTGRWPVPNVLLKEAGIRYYCVFACATPCSTSNLLVCKLHGANSGPAR